MAKAKKQEKSIEQRLEEALVLYEKTPYELPSNWCWTKLPYITQIKTGKRDANHAKEDGQYRFYTCSTEYSMADTYTFEGESIIVPGNGDIGLVFYYDGKFEAYQRTYVINGFKGQTKYLYYYFYYKWREKNTYKQFGTAIPYVRMANFEEFEIPLAPLEEQKRIVEIIDKQFAKLDEARDLIQESLDIFVDRKSAILHRAFTGELTKNWREKSKLNYDAIIKKLKDCCKISSGGTPSRKHPEYYDGNIPWIKTGEIEWNEIYDSEEHISEVAVQNSSAKCYEPEVVLVAMYGMGVTRGRAAILKVMAATNQAVCVLKPNNSLLIKYLYYYFMCYYWDIREQAVGGNQLNLSGTIISQLEISIPSIEEQEEIVRILDSIFEKEDKSKELLDMLDKIDEMKKSILARAFRGQLGTFNPTDEPATDLLRKILEQSN